MKTDIQNIYEKYFFTEGVFYYTNIKYIGDTFIAPKTQIHSQKLSQLHWTDMVKEKQNIFLLPKEHFKEDYIFYYFFPALIILSNDQDSSVQQLSLEIIDNKLSDSLDDIEGYSHLNRLKRYSLEQKQLIISSLEKIDQSYYFNKHSGIQHTIEALKWLNKADSIMAEIYDIFDGTKYMTAEKIMRKTEDGQLVVDSDQEWLIKNLQNRHWQYIAMESSFIEILAETDYIGISSEAFCYFMPACMIHSLKGVDHIFCPVIEQTLYRLCVLKDDDTYGYFHTAYECFSKIQREVVYKFLELFQGEKWYSYDDEGEISNALNLIWKALDQ